MHGDPQELPEVEAGELVFVVHDAEQAGVVNIMTDDEGVIYGVALELPTSTLSVWRPSARRACRQTRARTEHVVKSYLSFYLKILFVFRFFSFKFSLLYFLLLVFFLNFINVVVLSLLKGPFSILLSYLILAKNFRILFFFIGVTIIGFAEKIFFFIFYI